MKFIKTFKLNESTFIKKNEFNTMRKLIIVLITFLVIGAIGYFLIPVGSQKKSFGYSQALNAIPKRASFVIRCDNPLKKWRELSSSSIGGVLNQSESYKNIKELFSRIDSSKRELGSNLFNGKIFIAGVLTSGNQLNEIVSLEVGGASLEQVQKYLEEVLGTKSIKIKEYESIEINFYDLNGIEISFAQVDNVILFSSSSILIEEGIRGLSAEMHLPDNLGFKKLLKTADISSDGNFFINFNELGSYLNLFANSKASFIKSFKEFGGWAELDLNSKNESLMLNGFSFISDSISTYLSSFNSEKAQSLNLSSVLPENTGVLTYMSYSGFESFKAKYDKYLSQKQVLYKHQKNVLKINKKHSFTVETDFYDWIGDEMALFTINGDDASFEKNSGLILKVSDLAKAKKGLNQIHKSTKVNNEIKYQTLIINDLGLSNFLALVLGDEFKTISQSNYLIIEDYVIFANDVSTLKHIVNYYLRGKTLVKNIQFNKFYEQFSGESNLFYYCNFKLSGNYFNSVLSSEDLGYYNNIKDSLQKLQAFGLQINSNKNLFYTNAFLNYNSNEESQNISLLEVKLDTTYTKKPWIVFNHYTKEKELLVQDDNHKLYLINNVGKVLWERQLKEPIIGEVQQVDRYKNDKYQYVFVTKNKIHQIDRKNRDVGNYPIELKAPVSQGLAVLDYDKNRNYRMLVTQGKNIHNFKIDGTIVEGWKYKPSDDVASEPKLIQIKGKDYVVVSDLKGRVRILNRKGEDRIKLSNQLPSNCRNHFIWRNNALSNSGVLATDTSGTIFFVKLADEMETFTLKSFENDFKVNYQDFNGDGIIEFVVINDQSVQIFKNNKKLLTTISDIEFDPAYGVETFVLEDKRCINIVSDKKEMKIYGFDEEGVLLNGFPIDGISPSLVTDLDGNKTFDLIIGDQLGSLYIYSIGK